MTARFVSDAERRARLVVRHGLAVPYDSVEASTEAMVCWHATDNGTVYLSIGARVAGVTPADIDTALYDTRTVVKQMAMRRTIFAFPRRLLPAAIGASGNRVAAQERRRTIKQLSAGGDPDAATTLARLEDLAVSALTHEPLSASELRARVPELDLRIHVAPGTKWGGEQPLVPRLLTILNASGRVVRGPNDAHWRTSRPRWIAMETWLGETLTPCTAQAGYRDLVRAWLRTFGPGTEADLVWWSGSTKAVIRAALGEVGAEAVTLEGGDTGYLLPDDLDEVGDPGPVAALLPVLDPTTMGWKQRDFYLGPHHAQLFDRNGNGGNTAWWGGRIVGGWVQSDEGEIRLQLLEDLGATARRALETEARELEAWLGDVRVYTYFPSPLMRRDA